MTDLNDFNYTDGVEDVMANYINVLLASTMRSEYNNAETLSATRTLTDADTPLQRFNCNGANRIVKAPTADTVDNHPYMLVNATVSGTYTLTVQNNGGTVTHAVLNPSEFILMMPDGNGTYAPFGRPFSTVLTPAQITSDQNDYNPTGAGYADVIRVSSDAARSITGLGFPAGNKPVILINVGSFTITLSDASASSVAANRFAIGANFSLEANKAILVIYDATASRWRMVGGGGSSAGTYGGYFPHDGVMLNGKLSVTVASNNLTVAIKTLAGTNPSSSDPVYIRINNTVCSLTTSLSVTKNAATNWCNSGSAELATKEVDYFAYIIWNTTPATDILDIGFSRIPYGTVYSDFSGTTTNEKYLAYGNASAPTSTDDVVNIGRFAATLSAGAAYTWSVPTFTTTNLIQRPIFETRPLTWAPAWSASASMTYTSITTDLAEYKIVGRELRFEVDAFGTIGGTVNTSTIATLPFAARNLAYFVAFSGWVNTTGSAAVGGYCVYISGAVYFRRYDFGNWTAGTGRYSNGNGVYMI